MDILTLETIQALSPGRVWKYFFELSQIPRESGDEKRSREYIKQFAHKHDLIYKIDKAGNIVVKKEAAPGKKNIPALVLQGHLDMVCVKHPESGHDFTTDPITLLRNNDWITAQETTLGADNGIAVAMALAILEDEQASYGPIEALFTVSEETGLDGAFGLDISMIDGRILINLDSEDEGTFYVGSAGGGEIVGTLTPQRELSDGTFLDWDAWEVEVSGLTGGHSGGDIHLGRANAVKECVRFLKTLSLESEIRVHRIDGGTKRNVIPSECKAQFLLPPGKKELVTAAADAHQKSFLERYRDTDPDGKISAHSVGLCQTSLTPEDSLKLINALYITPHGVDRMSTTIKGIAETSTNLAAVQTTTDSIKVITSQRSAIESARVDISQRTATAIATCGAVCELVNTYPAWTPNPDSSLPGLVSTLWKDMTGAKPQVTAIHAGLECGVINSKAPDMESISFGPDITGAHSTAEAIKIDSVERMYQFLQKLLSSL